MERETRAATPSVSTQMSQLQAQQQEHNWAGHHYYLNTAHLSLHVHTDDIIYTLFIFQRLRFGLKMRIASNDFRSENFWILLLMAKSLVVVVVVWNQI